MTDVKFKKSIIVFIITSSILATILQTSFVNALDSYTYDSSVKEEALVLHSLDNPVTVGGQETKYVMDTRFTYRYQTQIAARLGSLFKPIGLPKISLSFFLSDPLTQSLEVNGQWKASLWVNSTAYKPVGFTVELVEVSQNGDVLYTTGQQSPIVISSIGEHLDVQVINYVLVAPINHVFQEGSAIQAKVDVNSGSSSEARVWFDSPLYPSKVILPCTDYARPISVKTFTTEGVTSDSFDVDAPSDKRTITISANVTDPLGSYDTASVACIITYNETQRVTGSLQMSRVTSPSNYQVFTTGWSYPANALRGNYTVEVTVIDNNGVYLMQQTSNPDPFTEQATHTFKIGPIIYYNPVITVRDVDGDSVPYAQVFVTFPSGLKDELPRTTSVNGTFSFFKVTPANYTFTVVWKNSVVAHREMAIDSNGPYNVTAEVYSLEVGVLDNSDKPVPGVVVFAYRGGLGYGFGITGDEGSIRLKVPGGIYDIEAHYSSTYLLSSVSTGSTNSNVTVGYSTSVTVVLEDYPPPIWMTNGFYVLIGGVVLLVIVMLIIRRNW